MQERAVSCRIMQHHAVLCMILARTLSSSPYRGIQGKSGRCGTCKNIYIEEFMVMQGIQGTTGDYRGLQGTTRKYTSNIFLQKNIYNR